MIQLNVIESSQFAKTARCKIFNHGQGGHLLQTTLGHTHLFR